MNDDAPDEMGTTTAEDAGAVLGSAEGAGTFREAADLVRETAGRLGDAWQQFVASVQDLLARARLFLRDDTVWSSVVRDLPEQVTAAIATIDGLLGRIRPGVDRIIELLRAVSGRAASVLALVETAVAHGGDVAGRLASLAADMRPGRRGLARKPAAGRAGTVSRRMAVGSAADLGHLGAELTGQFVSAAVDADETTPGGLPAYAGTLRRLADRVDQAARRTTEWTADFQRLLADARLADSRPGR
ncbi:hypothetical protein Ade02nite_50570 [Paractinoplanes deccanensis]|uniref:WXG100 family type VII secretion target n=1 Tax=Paractinoplanes deccanensis TaxID=113561 RepID=A0ABQ3Y8U2_9ACTN|nr:hypothetical protein [Actinoplanes deccanensis]GID76416.1 hypothetical protein Ade02nite_50570 [Actinoplanes deccanensis]